MNITRKSLCALLATAALTLALAGCGQPSSQAEYIGLDAAKTIALEAADVSESDASFSTTGLDRQNGTDFYAINFTANGQSYEYDIDAVTGIIISGLADSGQASASPEVSPSADSSPSQTTSGQSGTAENPGGTGNANTGNSGSTDTGNGNNGSTNTGNGGGSGNSSTSTMITEARAREIALNHAGVSASQVTFLKSRLDYDNGRRIYDVEFYNTSSYTEYDYEIDAYTGAVLSYDFDAEGYTPPASGTTTITADQAKQIALAKVPGATLSNIYEFELDRDDGRLEYEGSIYYNGMEYEFTIDGYSGAIRSWEVESYYD
ncbi:MAG TPA: PepSY domain-containing protein [Candidatus Enterenecus stercoripullorum]|nr:PepSY domain-containing protein [Candidatus Enterenecus stercoripullorum]